MMMKLTKVKLLLLHRPRPTDEEHARRAPLTRGFGTVHPAENFPSTFVVTMPNFIADIQDAPKKYPLKNFANFFNNYRLNV